MVAVYSKNKPSITSHHTQTNRSLCECDTQSTNYNNDEDMKSVKENFDRQTSRRFEEYEERIQEKRRKCKEQCDKDIQKIILKDKVEKSLAEKVEKCCFRCGFGLGGVAAGVGLFGGLGIYGWKTAALATAIAEGAETAKAAGEVARIPAAIDAVIAGIIKEFRVSTLGVQGLQSLFTAQNYNNVTKLALAINSEYNASSCLIGGSGPATDNSICPWVLEKSLAAPKIPGKFSSTYNSIEVAVKSIVLEAETVAQRAVEKATEEAIKASTEAVESIYASFQIAIIASVVALLIIVIVMIIIYLVLRYRRKKKMNKKAQYTKLLNQ
ncbi:hypothetical protein PFHG_04342 [Plasmodium falciparum HB3]|uniref:Rifin n=1 Tax=Plasmodium falciparum (isolate HB3) TaxID=137071 RepID=A0A0L7KH27_PLAFX|nr:hypothetical protein PFHG_04342 [Plasmodium falciparum HB3]